MQKHLFEVGAAIALDQRLRAAAVDDPVPTSSSARPSTAARPRPCCARPSGSSPRCAPAKLRDSRAPSRRCRGRARRSARRAATARARSAATWRARRGSSARPTACPPARSRKAPICRSAAKRLDPLAAPPQPVEPGVDQQVLAHRQPVRQVDKGRGEVHPRQHPIAMAQDVLAEHVHRAGTSAATGRAGSTRSSSCRRRCRRAVPRWCRVRR